MNRQNFNTLPRSAADTRSNVDNSNEKAPRHYRQAIRIIFLFTVLCAICVYLGSLATAAGFEDGRKAYQHGDYKRALLLFDQAAWAGDTNAQWLLGQMYLKGRGTRRDPANAASWFYKAATKGHAGAQADLAQLYYRGIGLKKDWEQAALWYQQSADQGDVRARTALAALYELGHGVNQSDSQAKKLYEQSTVQGDAEAMFKLGVFAQFGRASNKNINQALGFYRQAADRHHANAHERIGWLQENGLAGFEQDWAAAARSYEKSANLGSAWGQYRLGKLYEQGRGVPQNSARALQWISLAANRPKNNDAPQGAQHLYKRLYAQRPDDEKQIVGQYVSQWRAERGPASRE